MGNLLSLGISYSGELWSPLGSAELQDQKGRIQSQIHKLTYPCGIRSVTSCLCNFDWEFQVPRLDNNRLKTVAYWEPHFLPVKIKLGHFKPLPHSFQVLQTRVPVGWYTVYPRNRPWARKLDGCLAVAPAQEVCLASRSQNFSLISFTCGLLCLPPCS